MQRRPYLRRILYGGIILFLLYIIFPRRRSPQTLLTVPNISEFLKQNNSNNTHRRRIPRIIHQTWKTHNIPAKWNETVESVRQLNANHFEYRFWTDNDIHEFVRREEPYLYQHTFLKYPFDIQRVDAFRYILLHRLGGIYLDVDG